MLFLLAVVGFILVGVRLHFISSERATKDQIITFVQDNLEDLKDFTDKQANQAALDPVFKNLPVQRQPDFPQVLDFSYGGKGFGSANIRYGFYYLEKDDVQSTFQDRLKQKDEKTWFYREGTSDNTTTIEKIADGFYYYKTTD